jgi:TolB-like protein/Tfp pilus assembly protein PilF
VSGSDVFLSYNREDAAVAKLYADAFAREGLAVWWDQTLRSGETYDEVTEAALRGAKAVVVLWSPRSVSSHWVRAEATIAHRAKTLIPATIEHCDKPVMFELTQTADLTHWRGDVGDTVWQSFVSDVRRMVGRSAAPLEPVVPTCASVLPVAGAGIPNAGVLPFIYRGIDGEFQFLAEDLTEDVTRALAENDHFKVIASGKMAAWRGTTPDYDAIRQRLDVRYLVDGKLQSTGDAIRLTVELIDAATANAVWSHRFAASPKEIAAGKVDLSQIVASELAEHVMQAEMNRATASTGPYTGWDHVLRSLAFERVLDAGNARSILTEARSAVAVAPDFGLAHARLANAIMMVTAIGGIKFDDGLKQEIRQHITRALQLDGDNAAVIVPIIHASMVLGDGETCLRLARRAVELRPASPNCHHALGSAYMFLGRTDEAIPAYTDGLRCLGFNNTRSYGFQVIGWCHLLEGRPKEALEALDQSLATNPNDLMALKFKAVAEVQLKRERAAIASVRRLREIAPEATFDQLISRVTLNPRLGRRSGEHIAILRRLWDETGGDG